MYDKKFGNEVLYLRRKGKFKRIFKVFFYIVFIAVVSLSFGSVFSSGGDIGSIGLHILGQRDKVKVSKTIYYALNMGEYDGLEEAIQTSTVISQAGGGGYVWENNKKYIVLGAAYINKSDCQKVIENMADDYKATISEIVLKKCRFVVEDITRSERGKIEDCVIFCNKTFEKLYDISLDYDKGEISNIAVSSFTNSLKSQVTAYKTSIFELYSKYKNDDLNEIHKTLIKIEDTLDLLVNQMLTVENNTNLVKYAYLEILDNCYKLRNNLQ